MSDDSLSTRIDEIAERSGARAVAVAYHDYQTDRSFGYGADRWFHAASTIKVPVLLGVFAEIDKGTFTADSRLHVRNRFYSAVEGGGLYRVEASRDAGSQVQAHVGRTMRVQDLAKQMIVTSSNLATNLLVDLIGIPVINETLEKLGCHEGIELQRGVEDEVAYAQNLNNRVTAGGLVRVLRQIEEKAVSADASTAMLDILFAQEFRSGIPAGVPDSARVANKTGEISTVTHDAGLVYPEGREPYAVALLTEWEASSGGARRDTLAALSKIVFDHLLEASGD